MGGVLKISRPFTDGMKALSSMPDRDLPQVWESRQSVDTGAVAYVDYGGGKDRVLLRSYTGTPAVGVVAAGTSVKA